MGMKSNAVELFTSRFFYHGAIDIFSSARSEEENVCVCLCVSVAN